MTEAWKHGSFTLFTSLSCLIRDPLLSSPPLQDLPNPGFPDLRRPGAAHPEYVPGLHPHTGALHQRGGIQPEEHLAADATKQPVAAQLPPHCEFRHAARSLV